MRQRFSARPLLLEIQERLASQDHQDFLEMRARVVDQAQTDFQDHKDPLAPRDRKDPLERLDPLDNPDSLDHKENEVPQSILWLRGNGEMRNIAGICPKYCALDGGVFFEDGTRR